VTLFLSVGLLQTRVTGWLYSLCNCDLCYFVQGCLFIVILFFVMFQYNVCYGLLVNANHFKRDRERATVTLAITMCFCLSPPLLVPHCGFLSRSSWSRVLCLFPSSPWAFPDHRGKAWQYHVNGKWVFPKPSVLIPYITALLTGREWLTTVVKTFKLWEEIMMLTFLQMPHFMQWS
jgi:hypothetical protein